MKDKHEALKDVNWYTLALFTAGVYMMLGYVVHFNSLDWPEFLLISALVVFVELTPVKLPSGTTYSAAIIGVTYLLIRVSFSAAMFSVLLSTFAFNLKMNRGVRGIKWFRFFVTLGMYFIGYLLTWLFAHYVHGVNDFLVAMLATMIGEATNAILFTGIAASFGAAFWPILRRRIPELWLPTFVSGIILFRLLLVSTVHQLAQEVMYSAFFLAIVLFFSSEYIKQITFRDRRLEDSHQQYKSLFDFNPDLVCSLDVDGVILTSNPAGEAILGYSSDVLVGKSFDTLCDATDKPPLQAALAKTLKGKPQNFELTLHHSSGRLVEAHVTIGPTVVNESIVGAYLIVKDITERRESERTIQKVAFYDPLTNLMNRRLFQQRIEEALERRQTDGPKLGLMLLDLNRFKLINDSFGHAFGDQLLRQVAERLLDTVGNRGEIARMGGDEFVVLFEDIADTQELSNLAQAILDCMDSPLTLEDKQFRVSTSIGIAMYPDDCQNADALVRSADVAMYRAKLEGTNSYRFYAEDMKDQVQQELQVEHALQEGIDEKQFMVYYQPQFNIQTGRVIGVEALLRWDHPNWGLLGPSRFISVAERTGLITDLGYMVLREACRQNVAWQRAGFMPMTVSVNLSLKQFQQENLYDNIVRILEEEGMSARWLNLEITESTLAHDLDATVETLARLKGTGIRISIDDFGMGYSSLSYLRRMPIDHLKIDGSFIKEMITSSGDTSIVKTIIELGHQMGIRVIAEGVESAEHLQVLHSLGCDDYQGYYGSRALPVNRIEEFLRDNEVAAALE